ncbi:WhiB family transcriptional regulator [Nocardia tengchongensis]|uniref:WhiB family transcriptional regulator n=1 Tax=Nocardia tengchongensis TaxID=2055889 RepID=UPI0036AC9A4D
MPYQFDCPESWPDRACTQYPLDTFFPDPSDSKAVEEAQRVCRGCPALRRCASWAAKTPMTSCVVASVPMPNSSANPVYELAELRRIAADIPESPSIREEAA